MNKYVRILTIGLVMIMGTYYSLANPPVGLAAETAGVQASAENTGYSNSADSFWAKFEALVEMGKKARATGQPVEFKETFGEDEVNSAVEGLAAGYKDQLVSLKDAKVFFGDGSVYSTASCSILGMGISVSAIPEVWLENGKPKVRVKSLDIQGAPAFIDGFIAGIINQRIDAEYNRLLRTYDYFEIGSIVFESKQVTIAGVAR